MLCPSCYRFEGRGNANLFPAFTTSSEHQALTYLLLLASVQPLPSLRETNIGNLVTKIKKERNLEREEREGTVDTYSLLRFGHPFALSQSCCIYLIGENSIQGNHLLQKLSFRSRREAVRASIWQILLTLLSHSAIVGGVVCFHSTCTHAQMDR